MRSALAKDDVLIAIEQIKRNTTQLEKNSLVNGLKVALTDILPAKRAKARLIALVIVDENPTDSEKQIDDVYETLKSTQSTVNILTAHEGLNYGLLQRYVGNDTTKIYNRSSAEVTFA